MPLNHDDAVTSLQLRVTALEYLVRGLPASQHPGLLEEFRACTRKQIETYENKCPGSSEFMEYALTFLPDVPPQS